MVSSSGNLGLNTRTAPALNKVSLLEAIPGQVLWDRLVEDLYALQDMRRLEEPPRPVEGGNRSLGC